MQLNVRHGAKEFWPDTSYATWNEHPAIDPCHGQYCIAYHDNPAVDLLMLPGPVSPISPRLQAEF